MRAHTSIRFTIQHSLYAQYSMYCDSSAHESIHLFRNNFFLSQWWLTIAVRWILFNNRPRSTWVRRSTCVLNIQTYMQLETFSFSFFTCNVRSLSLNNCQKLNETFLLFFNPRLCVDVGRCASRRIVYTVYLFYIIFWQLWLISCERAMCWIESTVAFFFFEYNNVWWRHSFFLTQCFKFFAELPF